MKFAIETPGRSPGLRVISDIPDYRLCHLEGRNGIGKSVAARLLELATGAQPYAGMPNAWRTLKEQLGQTRIIVTGFPHGETLAFELDPEFWPDNPARDLGERFGRVSIDGQPASLEAAHALLRVRRISGDETLVQTLARDLDERAVFSSSMEREKVRPAASGWEVQLDALSSLTGRISRDALVAAWTARVEAHSAVSAADRRVESANALSESTSTALAAANQLAVRRRDLPDLLGELASTELELGAMRAQLEDAAARAESAAVALAASGSVRQDIEHWERLLGYRQRAVHRESIRERQLLSALSMQTRPDPAEVRRLTRAVETSMQDAIKRRDSVDLVQPLRQLASAVEFPLASEAHRLGGEVIANLRAPATVETLLEAVRSRKAELAGRPRPDELVRLDSEISATQRRLGLWRALHAQIDVSDRKKQRLAEATEQLDRLLHDLDASDRRAYETAQTAAELARDALVTAELRTREVRKRIAELLRIPSLEPTVETETENENEDEEDESADREPAADTFYPGINESLAVRTSIEADTQALESLEAVNDASLSELAAVEEPIDLSSLRAAAAAGPLEPLDPGAIDALHALNEAAMLALAAAASYRDASDQARTLAVDAAERLRGLRLGARHAHAALSGRGAPQWAGWAAAVAPVLQAAGVSTDTDFLLEADSSDSIESDADREPNAAELAVADALEAVAALAQAQAAASLDCADRLAALSGYLAATSSLIAPRGRDVGAVQASDFHRTAGTALGEWVERELASLLTAPELLAELFDGAEQVRVGLSDLTLTWHPAGGGVRKRPLEAFSSGEQVFAYTRANLARLGRERVAAQQLVVFLDEFGAFVARDRLGQLMDFVEHEAIGTVADQVVVMLPLSRDYPHPGNDEIAGQGADSLVERGRQIAARDYFAVPFTSGRAHLA